MRNYLIIFLLFLPFFRAVGQLDPLLTRDSLEQRLWVDNTYGQMSLEEKIGQLFMVMVASNEDASSKQMVLSLIRDRKLGGVIFSKGGPVRQAKLTNEFQKLSTVPLLIGMDAEWGLSMRLDSTYAFPWNMTLGAIADSTLVQKVAQRIGQHAKRLGVHINFAPDVDLNTNAANPIIGNRSFGEDRANVTRNGIAFVKGLEAEGILSSGKHFPGHGDTSVDSHLELPLITFGRERLDSLEMYPFRELVREGVSSIMVAHLNVPELEPERNLPSSLSENVITGILKNEMQFKGLIFTDALNMKGVADFGRKGETEVQAFLAGNDILLMPKDIDDARDALIKAYEKGKISEERLAVSVQKILMAKYKAGLSTYTPVPLQNLYSDLNSLEDDLLYEEAVENAVTIVKNNLDLIPVRNLQNKKIAYLRFGEAGGDPFLKMLRNYADVTEVTGGDIATLKRNLADYNLVIVGLHKSNESPWKSYKFTENELFWLQDIASSTTSNLILTVFTSPYALRDITTFEAIDAIVVAYQNSRIAQERTAEILFGAIPAKGKLPVTAHPIFPVNTGIMVDSISRLGYSLPEKVGLSSVRLAEVDRLVHQGIDSLMFPGAQVLVARHGKVVYNKAFGKPTYEASDSVTTDHIYDLASLTKILATLPVVMKMEEDHKIALNTTFQEMIPGYADSELKNVTVLNALSHYGRLPAWIAFYLDTLDKKRRPSDAFYAQEPKDGFSTKIMDGMYLSDTYNDSIYERIGRQTLKSNRYRYSDVAYYVLKKYIEDTYKTRMDNVVAQFLYQPIGASASAYNPLDKFPKERIIPSEVDDYYRYNLIQGYVHDMGAAMQGGVGGHAGLFSNANDVAKIMQMYLQGGYYGGVRFVEERTVEKFNKCYFCQKDVRRGVGFDKPQFDEKGPTCGCVSRKSFGHSGFTGTYTWADPEEDIVYVFLSNRTYPSASNGLLLKSALRTRIQKAIYDSIIN